MTNQNVVSAEEERENRKSQVRVKVTYWAAAFLFGGGSLFIVFYIFKGMEQQANALFLAILPVSASIVSFWFASRKPMESGNGNTSGGSETTTSPETPEAQTTPEAQSTPEASPDSGAGGGEEHSRSADSQ